MTVEIIIVFAVIVTAVALFMSEKLPVDLVALMVMAILLLSGIITPEEGISGFSNTATITVGAMFILSSALFKTGAVNKIGKWTIRAFRYNFWLGILIMMVLAGTLSAFINNTPVVAIFIPIIIGVAREIKRSPSQLLMPLSFASMFGGVCTLIGTSTNILLSSIAVRHGQREFGMFEFSSLGLIFFAVGTLYMLLIGIRLIPKRRTDDQLTQRFGMGQYLTEIIVLPEAATVGKSVAKSPLTKEVGVEIVEVIRDGKRLSIPDSRLIINENDVLRVAGDVEKLKKLQEREGIKLKASHEFKDNDLQSEDTTLAEAIIAPNSYLEGKSLKQTRFRDTFDVTALAIRRRDNILHTNLNGVKLRAGDALLLEVSNENIENLSEQDAFVFVSEVGLPNYRKRKIFTAVLIAAGVIGTAAMGLLPIVISAICGCVLMVITKCITLDEAYKAIDWKVIFLLAGALTLGVALEKTGAALLISNIIINLLGAFGPIAVVAVLYLLTSILTETMSNNATAVLLAPIAIAAAESLHIDPRPLLMTITFAASASFMTPVGYQTNTMIYGAGQYRFTDFIKVGTPLNIIFWIIATVFIPYFWPF
ncbi:MAG: SLC13 family permease [Bacteroidetes bacterium]|nr:SLC13 family permease [Bacteroidota bacterium]